MFTLLENSRPSEFASGTKDISFDPTNLGIKWNSNLTHFILNAYLTLVNLPFITRCCFLFPVPFQAIGLELFSTGGFWATDDNPEICSRETWSTHLDALFFFYFQFLTHLNKNRPENCKFDFPSLMPSLHAIWTCHHDISRQKNASMQPTEKLCTDRKFIQVLAFNH